MNEDNSILKSPALYGVVGVFFVCGFCGVLFGFLWCFLGLSVWWWWWLWGLVGLFNSMQNFAPFHKGESKIPFLVA